MESVEDILDTALAEGVDWGKWESFAESFDFFDGRENAVDFGSRARHSMVAKSNGR